MGTQLGFSGVAKPQSHALQHRGAVWQEGVSLKADVVVRFSSVLDICWAHLHLEEQFCSVDRVPGDALCCSPDSQPWLAGTLRFLHNKGPLLPHCALLFSSSFSPILMHPQHHHPAPTGLSCPVSPLERESFSTLLPPALQQHFFSPQNQVHSTQLHSLIQNFAGIHHRYTIAVQLQE